MSLKILCFSDLHCDCEAATKLVTIAQDVDLMIGAGDFANRHRGIADTLNILKTAGKPSVLVPGNGETVGELREATRTWRDVHVLHGEGCQIDGIDFWGVGGGIPVTPFGDWSFDFNENQAEEMLAGCPAGAILVVHSPPLGTVDHDSSGQIQGSQSVRKAVEAKQPLMVVCGHIHSDWGKQVRLAKSLILNAGPVGKVMELTKSANTHWSVS